MSSPISTTMNFLKKLFGGKTKNEEVVAEDSYMVATLNDRLMPLDRGEVYEDPLDEFLQSSGIGEVTGGGTMQLKNGEIEYCDLEIKLRVSDLNDDQIGQVIQQLEQLGAPKGSKLNIEKTNETFLFGKQEGLGIYLDGINLGNEVYQNSDSNVVVDEIKKLVGDTSETARYWEGSEETALYFYADSFVKMKDEIQAFVNEYPLCKNARIEQVA